MSGINQGVVFDVCRLKAQFADDIGNTKEIVGTGFWLKHKAGRAFVTNKHNVDPTLKLGPQTPYRLVALDIELRAIAKGGIPTPSTKYFPVDVGASIIEASLKADAAVILNPRFSIDPAPYRSAEVLSTGDLANITFFSEKIALMDSASFIGFAGNHRSQWWDQQWNLGVARTVNIASVPSIPFTHPDVCTSDVTLVAGLSFSGSSGSVVLSHEKGINTGGVVQPRLCSAQSHRNNVRTLVGRAAFAWNVCSLWLVVFHSVSGNLVPFVARGAEACPTNKVRSWFASLSRSNLVR